METRSVTAYPDAPDIESSTRDYATRFNGAVGQWFLECQRNAARAHLKGSGLKVLDVGGGHGQNVETVCGLGHSLTIFGSSESTTEMIDDDIESGKVTYESGNYLSLPDEDNSFDVVISFRTLSHMDHWNSLISELVRVARSTVIVDYPSSRSFNILYNPMFFIKKNIETNTREFYCYSSDTITTAFDKNGCELEGEYKQFFLPMALHRFLGVQKISAMLEGLFRVLMLTRLFGSPVISGYRKSGS